jgi:hypothetical protein
MAKTNPKIILENPTTEVSLGHARYGTPRPQIEIRVPKGAPFRRLNAALHTLAAEIELATPMGETWVVATDALSDTTGIVYLELADGEPEETKRGLALLQAVRPTPTPLTPAGESRQSRALGVSSEYRSRR